MYMYLCMFVYAHTNIHVNRYDSACLPAVWGSYD